MTDFVGQEREPKCDRTTVCVLREGHRGPCMRPGGVKVVTTSMIGSWRPQGQEILDTGRERTMG